MEENINATLFWYNPNIHPYTEYSRRRDTLKGYAKKQEMPLIINDEYGLRQFLEALCTKNSSSARLSSYNFDSPDRCAVCYKLRMEKTAFIARENGFDTFSTTLFISPYQNHELLKEEAAAAEQFGPALLYRDFRPRFRKGRAEARQQGLYMQQYCGCIFSEEERYGKGSSTNSRQSPLSGGLPFYPPENYGIPT
jgi:predicted adenine nucleotide alpha hydrolase (AANH) superfamily ATPase